jgi:hypothetical protein
MLKPVTVAMPEDKDRHIERLALKVADLQSENRNLRRRLPDVGDMKRLRQAHRDAKAMLLHRFDGYSISRANCLALGIPERRWNNARALLQTARIHDGLDITESDFDAAVGRLEQTVKSMEAAGNAERLRMRLPNSRAWGR